MIHPKGRGRYESRVPKEEMKIIIEETIYLLSLGFQKKRQRLIIAGIEHAMETFDDQLWINIADETLRWHCKNFYEIGLENERA